MTRRISSNEISADAGWRELHQALIGGVPRGAEIVMLLDASGFCFPTAPEFDSSAAELRCYGVVHGAWREDVLADMLRLLQLWREGDGPLDYTARRREFQQALVDFVCEHRSAGTAALVECLSQLPLEARAAASRLPSVEAVRQCLNAAWDGCAGRRAA